MRSITYFDIFFVALVSLAGCSCANDRESSHMSNSDTAVAPTIQRMLDKIDGWKGSSLSELQNRPFVTVAFAQSLDAKIALYLDDGDQARTTANFPLSGPESLLLTHGLRSIHDGILVGGRTLATDNPRLTNRLWNVPSSDDDIPYQPRPIVLDSELRNVRECLASGLLNAKNLIVCCSREAVSAYSESIRQMEPSICLLPCERSPNNAGAMLDLTSVLSQLKEEFGMQSIMVEGGSAVISAFVQQDLVDCLCVTIAPKIIGSRGLSAFSFGRDGNVSPIEFEGIECTSLGHDCIVLSRRQ